MRSRILLVSVVVLGCGKVEAEPPRADSGTPDVASGTREAGRHAADAGCDSGEPGVSCEVVPGPWTPLNPGNVQLLAVDDSNVYVTDRFTPASWEIVVLPRAGGTAWTLVTSTNVVNAVSDGSYLYWSGGRLNPSDPDASNINAGLNQDIVADINRVPVTGGTVETLVTNDGFAEPVCLAVDQDTVYWTNIAPNPSVLKVAKTGGTVTTLSTFTGMSAIALDDTKVYYLDVDVMSVPKAGGTPVSLTTSFIGAGIGFSGPGCGGLARVGSTLYAVLPAPSAMGLTYFASVPTTGSTDPTVLLSESVRPSNFATDGTRIFWPDQSNAVAIEQLVLGGASVTTLATFQSPTSYLLLASDGTLYWATGNQVQWMKP